mmetsp:Transcript_33690/g.103994  ORF Transcript_33690/g.103994 Transcript_33690/m.103994 type:complete len:286 (-) Transcript_33690:19-876(-)
MQQPRFVRGFGVHQRDAHSGRPLRVGRVDDLDELRLEGSTTNQEAVDVFLGVQVVRRAGGDGAAVEDAERAADLVRHVARDPLADERVHLLGLLRRGDLAGADGPNRLVRDDDLVPLGLTQHRRDGLQLRHDHGGRAAVLAVAERLADARDDAEPLGDSGLHLGADDLVRLVPVRAALAVADDGPVDARVLEHLERHLARERTALRHGVLRRDTELGVGEERLDEREVQHGRGDDAVDVVLNLGLVEDADEVLDEGHLAVALPVGRHHGLRELLAVAGRHVDPFQ